jgi:hypothetical protein
LCYFIYLACGPETGPLIVFVHGLDDHPIPDLFAKQPHEVPELLFHGPASG